MKPKTLLFSILLVLLVSSLFFPLLTVQAQKKSSIRKIQGPLEPTVTASNLPDYSLMANGTYLAHFKSDSSAANSVMIEHKGYTFTMDIHTSQLHWYNSTYNAIIGMQQEMNPQATTIAISGNTFTYKDAWVNTDLRYHASVDMLKEELIIRAVSAPSSSIKPDYLQYAANCYYNNSLTIYADGVGYLHPSNQKFVTKGQIDFNDAQNRTVFWLPPPIIYDSAQNQAKKGYMPNSTVGSYAVTANNGVLVINIRVPKAFIDNAVYPVYLDPIVKVQGNARSTGSTASGTFQVTLGSAPTSGNLLILTMCAGSAGASNPYISSISQTGVTWTVAKAHSTPNSYGDAEIWKGSVGAGADTTINVTVTGGDGESAEIADVCEWAGLDGTVDKTAENGGEGTTGDSGTTASTTQNDELAVAAISATRPMP